MTRKWTNRLVEEIEEGAIDPREVVQMCLNYMSEADVEDMCLTNDIDLFQEEDNDDE